MKSTTKPNYSSIKMENDTEIPIENADYKQN